MKRRATMLAVSASVLLLAAGCSLTPKSNSSLGSMLVSSKSNSPVYINDIKVGTTNQEITGLNVGVANVSVGDPENPVWSGEVALTGGDTVTVTPKEGEFYTDGPPRNMDDTTTPAVTEKAISSYTYSLIKDFPYRDTLPQTNTPEADWFKYSTWGPMPATYPTVAVPYGTLNPVQWKRDRVVEVAKHFIGVPYKHYHIPKLGLDCSNFTAWVYNYGFGIRFTSAVGDQAKVAGRKLSSTEGLKKGDLMFFWNTSRTAITHAAIYVDQYNLIDSTITSTTNGVAVRPFKYWYKDRFAYGRRLFE